MADTVEIDGNTYAVSGYAEDGLPIIKATATSIQNGFDEDGNPNISVNINVPPVMIGVIPGEVQ